MPRKPIIIVEPRKNKDIKAIEPKGGGYKVFDPNNIAYKRTIIKNDLTSAYNNLKNQFLSFPKFPGVLKITIIQEAIAKSHRPSDFLGNMKVLTYGLPTEIYASATEADLKIAIKNCDIRKTKKYIANISTICSIKSVLPEDKKVLINDEKKHDVSLKFFEYDDLNVVAEAEKTLDQFLNSQALIQKKIMIKDKVYARIIKNINNEQILKLRALPFVMSIREVAQVNAINTITNKDTRFVPQIRYTLDDNVIAVVDSGISDNAIPGKYIYGRESYIPEQYQDNSHGTFVASTILFGNEINGRKENKPINFKLLDVTIIPKRNSGLSINDSEFCECLKDCVEKYHDTVKIWNLSLGFPDSLVGDMAISDVGAFCDELQKAYNIQFVIAAGNYEELPFRVWPSLLRTSRDRIISPADSMVAITVGSLAEKDCSYSFSKKDEPSPFSRRGPGACLLFKPDLTDYGGNLGAIDNKVTYDNIGIIGLDINGCKCESIGTSISTPLVTYKLSKIYSSLVNKDLLLSKALLIHDAIRNSKQINDMPKEARKYYGFGKPSTNCERILDCNDNEITVVFECNLLSGTMIDIRDFPIPGSMYKNGKYKGEIFATLVSDPCFDKRYGYEYSRVNFDLSIGTYSISKDGELKYNRQVEPIKIVEGKKFESELVEEDLKWNSIKSYYRNISKGIIINGGWRINVQSHSRFLEPRASHKCYIVMTFIGSDDTVYDEAYKLIKDQGFSITNVEIVSDVKTTVSNK